MAKILKISSSANGARSNSNKLADAIVAKIQAEHAGSTVKEHNLAAHPYPHLEEAHLAAFFSAPETASKEALAHSNDAISELQEADTIVIGVPTYNFNIPSVLKAWIDHTVRSGITFRYSEKGIPEGLVKNKKVYLAISSGGIYSEGPMMAYNFTEPYLRAVLGFIGLTDVTVFRIEGLAVPGVQDTAVQKGIDSIKLN